MIQSLYNSLFYHYMYIFFFIKDQQKFIYVKLSHAFFFLQVIKNLFTRVIFSSVLSVLLLRTA